MPALYGHPDNTDTTACPHDVRCNRVPLDSCVTCVKISSRLPGLFVITKIINYWKNALVFPVLKKDGLKPIFKNYRPVSNLQFIFKLTTENAVAKQLQHHINMHNLFPWLQSPYRKFHITESALLRVKNDILLNVNRQHVTLLVLLHLTPAFGTIDHGILLERLRSAFRVRDTALSWFASYLSGRTQQVQSTALSQRSLIWNAAYLKVRASGLCCFVVYASKIFEIVGNII